jgi:uncharacterized protein
MSKRKMMGWLLFVLGLLIVGFEYSALTKNAQSGTVPKAFALGDSKLNLIIADIDALRQHGLSDRESLDQNTGMLFVFEKPDYHGFWMKDMHFSIDMLWLDETFKIVHIAKDVAPETYPQSFISTEPAKYVLEVNAGYSDLKALKKGDILKASY